VVGDPKGITIRDCGRHQNLRLRTWRRTHLLACLADKAQLAGIKVVLVNERGTSSTCPECHKAVPKPKGRCFSCPHCGHTGHRDLVGARNIAARGGGSTRATARVTHRRAGLSQHGRTGAVSDSTSAGPARHRAARGDPGVARRGVVREPDPLLRG